MSLHEALFKSILRHPLFSHSIFLHWVSADPDVSVLGAAFHQIQMFCAATRPVGHFSEGLLQTLGSANAARLMQEIADGETGHGEALALMAAYIINRKAEKSGVSWEFSGEFSRGAVESALKKHSDRVLGSLPGYDRESGLAVQTRHAMRVFSYRDSLKKNDVLYSIGAALALEMASHRQIIPGEKYALVDSGRYGTSLEDAEMAYLKEHCGECGAEALHEKNVVAVAAEVLSSENAWHYAYIEKGATDFLESLTALWDLIDAALFMSGCAHRSVPLPPSFAGESSCSR